MATFTISDFTAKLKAGGARPNLFKVSIPTLPAGVSGASFTDFSFMCKGASLPGSTMGVISIPYQGRELKVAGDREFGQLVTTVINDEGFAFRNVFEKWVNALNTHQGNVSEVEIGDRTKYTADLTVTTMTKGGADDQVVNFIDCWPSIVSNIDLNWDSTNAIQEYTVTWEYEYYTHAAANII